MKATIESSDPLFQQAKERRAEEGLATKQRMEVGLRLRPFGFGGDGPMTHDWASIRELACEGRGGVASLVPTE